MARKSDMSDLFKKTEPGPGRADQSDLDRGNIRATGVGLREGEISALDAIGTAVGAYLDAETVSRNSIIRIATRRLILAYRSGELGIADIAAYFHTPEKPKPKLDL